LAPHSSRKAKSEARQGCGVVALLGTSRHESQVSTLARTSQVSRPYSDWDCYC